MKYGILAGGWYVENAADDSHPKLILWEWLQEQGLRGAK